MNDLASIFGFISDKTTPQDVKNREMLGRKGVGMGATLDSIGDRIQQTQQARVDLARYKADKIGEYIANRQRMEMLARGLGAIGGY